MLLHILYDFTSHGAPVLKLSACVFFESFRCCKIAQHGCLLVPTYNKPFSWPSLLPAPPAISSCTHQSLSWFPLLPPGASKRKLEPAEKMIADCWGVPPPPLQSFLLPPRAFQGFPLSPDALAGKPGAGTHRKNDCRPLATPPPCNHFLSPPEPS